MIRFHSTRSQSIILAIWVVIATSAMGQEKPALDPHEPNNTPEQAKSLLIGKPVEIVLDTPKDVDWFSLAVPGPGYLECRLVKQIKGLNISASFYTAAKKNLGTFVAVAENQGTYFLSLTPLYGSSAKSPITIQVNYYPEVDFFEPNNSLKQAAKARLNQWMNLGFIPASDIDFFKLQIPGRGHLWGEMNWGKIKPFTLSWGLYDAKGQLVNQVSPPYLVEKGTYVVSVGSRWNSDWSSIPVRTRFRFQPELDQLEPNDKTPRPLKLDTTYNISLPHAKDVDQWEVIAPGRGLLSVNFVRPPDRLHMLVTITQGERKIVRTACQVSQGKVNLTLQSQFGGFSLSPFQMYVHFAKTSDTFEPNDKKEEAKPFPLNQPVQAQLMGLDDVDWFSLDFAEDGMLYVLGHTFEIRKGGAYPAIEVVDQNEKVLHLFEQHPKKPKRSYAIKKGTYWLRLRHGQFNYQEVQDFCLNVYFLPKNQVAAKPEFRDGLGVSIIGLEPDQATNALLQILARETKSSYKDVSNAAEIEKEMRAAIDTVSRAEIEEADTATRREANASTIPLILGILFLLAVMIVFFKRAFRKK